MKILLYGTKRDQSLRSALVTELQLKALAAIYFGGRIYHSVDEDTSIEHFVLVHHDGNEESINKKDVNSLFNGGMIHLNKDKYFVRAGVRFTFYKLAEWLETPLNHLAILEEISF